ncbi:hypothetical protein Pmani_026672, partial [Petrolisthes manimaculis]
MGIPPRLTRQVHGNLKTSNCLVDSRWVVKISDFGLHQLKSGTETTSLTDASDTQRRCTDLLYRAPELMRDPSAPRQARRRGMSIPLLLFCTRYKGVTGHGEPLSRVPSP